jgi:hypothetical protein
MVRLRRGLCQPDALFRVFTIGSHVRYCANETRIGESEFCFATVNTLYGSVRNGTLALVRASVP